MVNRIHCRTQAVPRSRGVSHCTTLQRGCFGSITPPHGQLYENMTWFTKPTESIGVHHIGLLLHRQRSTNRRGYRRCNIQKIWWRQTDRQIHRHTRCYIPFPTRGRTNNSILWWPDANRMPICCALLCAMPGFHNFLDFSSTLLGGLVAPWCRWAYPWSYCC